MASSSRSIRRAPGSIERAHVLLPTPLTPSRKKLRRGTCVSLLYIMPFINSRKMTASYTFCVGYAGIRRFTGNRKVPWDAGSRKSDGGG